MWEQYSNSIITSKIYIIDDLKNSSTYNNKSKHFSWFRNAVDFIDVSLLPNVTPRSVIWLQRFEP